MQDKLQNVQYIYIISEQSASRLQAGTDSNKKIKNIRDKISIAALHMNQNHQWTAIPGKINEAHTGQTVSWEWRQRRRGLPWQARASQASQGDRPQTQLNWLCNRNSQGHVGKSSLATKGRLWPPCKAPLLLLLLPYRWVICEALPLDTSVFIAGKGIHRMNQTAPPMPTQCISVYHVLSFISWIPISEKIRLVPAGIYSYSAKVAAPGHVHFQMRWTC